MIDWNGYHKQLLSRIGDLGRGSPDTLNGYQTLSAAGEKTQKLSAKTRELIALAVAVTARCDGCIVVHAEAALKAGAEPDEISEALAVAVALGAGTALVYSARALDAIAVKSGAAAAEAVQ
jgi:AhpD family alkylhydroperoxidase